MTLSNITSHDSTLFWNILGILFFSLEKKVSCLSLSSWWLLSRWEAFIDFSWSCLSCSIVVILIRSKFYILYRIFSKISHQIVTVFWFGYFRLNSLWYSLWIMKVFHVILFKIQYSVNGLSMVSQYWENSYNFYSHFFPKFG